MRIRATASVCVLAALGWVSTATIARGENWPGWRGPRGDGTSLERNVPIRWNGKEGRNIAWKVEIPGRGHASPIVWEDRIFLVTCREDQQDRVLLCLDRATGRILWEKPVIHAPLEKKHTLNSYASSTPATDGRQVYVTFLEPDLGVADLPRSAGAKTATAGRMVVAAYDFQGRQQWLVRPGSFSSVRPGEQFEVVADSALGENCCASPAISQGRIYLRGQQHLYCIGGNSGGTYPLPTAH